MISFYPCSNSFNTTNSKCNKFNRLPSIHLKIHPSPVHSTPNHKQHIGVHYHSSQQDLKPYHLIQSPFGAQIHHPMEVHVSVSGWLWLETFRFYGEDDYEDKIFSILSRAQVWTRQCRFGWELDSSCHSATGFSEKVVVAETSYQIIEVLLFCDQERA